MPWYDGPPLPEVLETVDVSADRDLDHDHLRLPVQWVARPRNGGQRVYTGQMASGTLRAGDEIVVVPSGAAICWRRPRIGRRPHASSTRRSAG